MLGIEPILKIIYKLKDKSTEEIIDKINDLIKKHSGNPPYEDDIIFLCLKI